MRRATTLLGLVLGAGPVGAQPSAAPAFDAGVTAAAPQVERPAFPAGDVAIRAWVDPPRVLLGDVFHLLVEVRHPAGHTVTLPEKTTWGKLRSAGPVQQTLLAEPPRKDAKGKDVSSVVETFRFPLQAFELGDLETPAMELSIPGLDVTEGALTLDPLPVTVERLTPKGEEAQPAPMAPAVAVYRQDPRFLAWPPLLALFGVLWLLVWWLDRRRPAHVVALAGARATVVLPPHRIALDKLEALRRSGLLEKGKTAAFVEEATNIAREYLEVSYGVPVLEQTTDEAVASLGPAVVGMVANPEKRRLGRLNLEQVKAVLMVADMVKFAKGAVAVADCARLLDDVIQLVETTRPLGTPQNTPDRPAVQDGPR